MPQDHADNGSDERARLIGMNHIALEVGDIDAALEFWAKIFQFDLRSRSNNAAFIDMGDQFIALMKTDQPHRDEHRHFGLVVDDRSKVRELAKAAGAEVPESWALDIIDPWGNFIQVLEYRDIQYSKTEAVQRGMGMALEKTEKAEKELSEKGMA